MDGFLVGHRPASAVISTTECCGRQVRIATMRGRAVNIRGYLDRLLRLFCSTSTAAAAHRQAEFGRQDDPLRRAEAVDVRGVPEHDSEFHGLTKDRFGCVVSRDQSRRFAGSPKLMQPNAIRLTFKPVDPRRVYFMWSILRVALAQDRPGSWRSRTLKPVHDRASALRAGPARAGGGMPLGAPGGPTCIRAAGGP